MPQECRWLVKNSALHYSKARTYHFIFCSQRSSWSYVEIRDGGQPWRKRREKKKGRVEDDDGKKMAGAGSLTTRARTRDCALPSFLPSAFNLAPGAKIERVTVNRRTNRWCTYREISGSGAGSLFANLEEHPGIICCKLLRWRAIANGVRPTLLTRHPRPSHPRADTRVHAHEPLPSLFAYSGGAGTEGNRSPALKRNTTIAFYARWSVRPIL